MSAHTSDPALVVGRLGSIENANDEACLLFGYSRAELLRMHGSELVLPEDHVRVAHSVDRMRRGEVEMRKGRVVRRDGKVIPVEVFARPLSHSQVSLTVRPITG